MKVGILGLGLIGGSLARAYALEGHTVYAIQRNESMLSFAMLSGAVHGRLDETTIPACDLILLAIYPGGLQPVLPSRRTVRLHLRGRASHGRLPVLRLQIQPGKPLCRRAHGAGSAGV